MFSVLKFLLVVVGEEGVSSSSPSNLHPDIFNNHVPMEISQNILKL